MSHFLTIFSCPSSVFRYFNHDHSLTTLGSLVHISSAFSQSISAFFFFFPPTSSFFQLRFFGLLFQLHSWNYLLSLSFCHFQRAKPQFKLTQLSVLCLVLSYQLLLDKVTDAFDQLQMHPSNFITFPDQFSFLFSTMTISNPLHSIHKPLIFSFSVYDPIFCLTKKTDPLDGNFLLSDINTYVQWH